MSSSIHHTGIISYCISLLSSHRLAPWSTDPVRQYAFAAMKTSAPSRANPAIAVSGFAGRALKVKTTGFHGNCFSRHSTKATRAHYFSEPKAKTQACYYLINISPCPLKTTTPSPSVSPQLRRRRSRVRHRLRTVVDFSLCRRLETRVRTNRDNLIQL